MLFCDGVNPKEGFGVASAMQAPVGLATERAVPALLADGHCFGRQAAGAWRSHKRRTPSLSALAPQLLPSGNIQRRARQNLHRHGLGLAEAAFFGEALGFQVTGPDASKSEWVL